MSNSLEPQEVYSPHTIVMEYNLASFVVAVVKERNMDGVELDLFLRSTLITEWDQRMHKRDAKRMHIWSKERCYMTPSESAHWDMEVLFGHYSDALCTQSPAAEGSKNALALRSFSLCSSES